MIDEMSVMSKEVRRWTLLLVGLLILLSFVFFHDDFLTIGGGILIGALCGLIGFNMIRRMIASLDAASDASKAGYSGYLRRYLVYALILGVAAWRGISVIALLAGMLCHKAALFIYVFMHRKEDD